MLRHGTANSYYGASGAGTTTLGEHVATKLRRPHFDTDDFFWLPTDSPFRTRRDPLERLLMLTAVLEANVEFVLAGSLDGWGDPLIPRFTSVVFLETTTETRLPPATRGATFRLADYRTRRQSA